MYLLASVGVTIYHRRHAVPTGDRIGDKTTLSELRSCHEELSDVTDGLAKHLESFHRLLDHYDATAAQQWADSGDYWRGQWKALSSRCRFSELPGGTPAPELDAMAAVHQDLGQTEAIYTKNLLRFGREEAPRLDRIRERIVKIGQRLEQAPQKVETAR